MCLNCETEVALVPGGRVSGSLNAILISNIFE